MNKYLDALWELKLRVDAYNEKDEKANRAFDILKDFILRAEGAIEKVSEKVSTNAELVEAVEFMKKHVEVQEHPDMFFHREQPERLVIDLRYCIDTPSLLNGPHDFAENNKGYNLVKKVLGLPEYKESEQ